MKKIESLFILSFIILITITLQATDVGKWQRYVITLPNNSYSGNPFELEVDGIFTHTASGTVITLPGYYDGNDTWKVAFMPTALGEWTYTTASPDPDLNGITGSLNCVPSNRAGMLLPEGKKWKYTNGDYVIPLIFLFNVGMESGSSQRFAEIADFLKNDIKGNMFDFHLTNEGINPHYPFFSGNWQNHEFNLNYWTLLEERMDILAARDLGVYLMFYSDDAGAPAWSGQSSTEELLIRYTVARLAGYPVVWFDTGIDISEYRSQSDVNWMGQKLELYDPYNHPRSNRHGGGSGNYQMSNKNYDSRGDRTARVSSMQSYFLSSSIPVSMTDAFMEEEVTNNWPYKNFTKEDIRRAAWKCVVTGGLGMIVRGSYLYNGDLYFRMNNFETDLESEQWLTLINPFISEKLGSTFGLMQPDQSLVSNGYCIADPDHTMLLYFLMGVNDSWDNGNGGDITVKLNSLGGSYSAIWFDTRTGVETTVNGSPFAGGSDYVITPPSTDDWVLYLTNMAPDTTPPSEPLNLNGIPVSDTEIELSWQPAIDPESGISHYKIFRDDNYIGDTPSLQYNDVGLTENTTYSYKVSAVNGAGLESGYSTPVIVTTLADTTPPLLIGAQLINDSVDVAVVYSEPVEEVSATDISNYQIDNNISIYSATLLADLHTVVLSTSPHAVNVTYTLTVNNIQDRASVPNAIAPNSQINYTYFQGLQLTNLVVNSNNLYQVSDSLYAGAQVYTDRSYTYASLPSNILGRIPYIETANDDKLSQGDNFLSFNVNRDVLVYIAHDDRYQVKPNWLNNFTDSGYDLEINGRTMSLFKKNFSSGTVTLGGNTANGSGNYNMYTVIVVADEVNSISTGEEKISGYILEQNYPNPFNPETKIRFSVPNSAPVTLKVFNLLGQEVATLFSERVFSPGSHEVSFDGGQLPSGIYYYRLLTKNFFITRKMLLLR